MAFQENLNASILMFSFSDVHYGNISVCTKYPVIQMVFDCIFAFITLVVHKIMYFEYLV